MTDKITNGDNVQLKDGVGTIIAISLTRPRRKKGRSYGSSTASYLTTSGALMRLLQSKTS